MTGGTTFEFGRPMIGSQIAGYQLVAEIGRGGMAVVYLARELRLDRHVAFKVMAPALASDAGFRHRFEREAQLAASIDHPHIIPVYAAGQADDLLFIAMRYVDGEDLRRLMGRRNPLPVEHALALLGQISSALDAAHARGLVHRDVKPANILIDNSSEGPHPGHAYLTDFGLTKRSASASGVTVIGQLVGTLDYISPEQIENRPLDGRADQYALACMAYEMLTGMLPFDRDDDRALVLAHLASAPPRISDHRSALSPAADAVLAKALAKSATDRYPTCQDFIDALRQATAGPAERLPEQEGADRPPTVIDTSGPVGVGSRPPTVPASPPPRTSQPTGEWRGGPLVIWAIALAALGGVLVFTGTPAGVLGVLMWIVAALLALRAAFGRAPQAAGVPPEGRRRRTSAATRAPVSGAEQGDVRRQPTVTARGAPNPPRATPHTSAGPQPEGPDGTTASTAVYLLGAVAIFFGIFALIITAGALGDPSMRGVSACLWLLVAMPALLAVLLARSGRHRQH